MNEEKKELKELECEKGLDYSRVESVFKTASEAVSKMFLSAENNNDCFWLSTLLSAVDYATRPAVVLNNTGEVDPYYACEKIKLAIQTLEKINKYFESKLATQELEKINKHIGRCIETIAGVNNEE